MKRLNIVVGHFGSGKTEFALNLAIKQKLCYNNSVIVDMDIVNPYFRTKDVQNYLNDLGVDVIAPQFASTNVDIPSLPSSINSVFGNEDRFAVLDVGGDEDGAVALGRYNALITKEDYDMFFVINTKRPLTQSVEDIITVKEEIEHSSRLKVTGLINNSNLSYETIVENLIEGQKIIEQVSQKTGLPIKYICGTKDILNQVPNDIATEKFELTLKMALPFMA